MFSAIKKLFRRKSAVDFYTRMPEPEPEFNPATEPEPVNRVVATPQTRRYVPKPAHGSELSLPLKPILERLSPDLMRMLRILDVGDAAILLPLQGIIAQIPRGAVKITFGELRAASPQGVFSGENVLDHCLVDIPLQEIICRLDPALLAKRPAQHHVVVPDEVSGPFGDELGKSAITSSKTPAAAPVAARVRPAVSKSTEHTARPVARVRATPAPVRVTPVPDAAPAAAQAQPVVPIASSIPSKSFETSRFKKTAAPGASPVSPPIQEVFNRGAAPAVIESGLRVFTPIDPDPVAGSANPSGQIAMGDLSRNLTPATPITPIAPEPISDPEPIRFQTPPVLPESATPLVVEPVADGRFLTVSLAELSAAWPDAVQREIASHQISEATVCLPVAMIEVAIKQGKVSLPWRVMRSWVQPPGVLGVSTFDATVLELPLKVITPPFLAEMKSIKPQRQIVIDPAIPDLFSGGSPSENDAAVFARAAVPPEIPLPVPTPARAPSQPANIPKSSSLPPPSTPVEPMPLQPSNSLPPVAAGLAPKKASETNYYGKNSEASFQDDSEPLLKQGGSLSTAFLNRYATPNEIVGKAMALDGVEGALVALPDGLLVASQIPSSMNAETIAAFLPQLFGKVSQCTKELRLGELNNLNFTVGQIPWKIYKVGAIYFAAFGRAGEPLPTAPLAAVAAELDRNPKN